MLDQHRDFGAGVEVFPCEHRAGLVVVKDYFISTIALFTQATLTVFAPHLERCFVVIEPSDAPSYGEQVVHRLSWKAEVKDVHLSLANGVLHMP